MRIDFDHATVLHKDNATGSNRDNLRGILMAQAGSRRSADFTNACVCSFKEDNVGSSSGLNRVPKQYSQAPKLLDA